jgi:tRNA-dihydrouridine synthase
VTSAVRIPVIVNGDIMDVDSARTALAQSGADGLMIGRGIYGRPWLARDLDCALNDNSPIVSRELMEWVDVLSEHMDASLSFYGAGLGLKMFKKHLGSYIESGAYHPDPSIRRQDKGRICRLDDPQAIMREVRALVAG